MHEDGYSPSEENGRNIDVLVVDDDEAVRSELVSCLDRSRLSCMSAADGWAALRLVFEGWRPNLIVADIRMPELSGLEFAEQIGKFYRGDRPGLVLISGHPGFDEVLAALRLGAIDFLPKPIDLRRLVQVVRTIQLDKAQPRTAMEMRSEAGPAPVPGSSAEKIRYVLSESRTIRRLRGQYLSDSLFSEPSWEMLLELHYATLVGGDLSATSLGGTTNVPMTTALRRIGELEQAGMIVRTPDGHDRRRAKIELSPQGKLAVEGFLRDYFRGRQAGANVETSGS